MKSVEELEVENKKLRSALLELVEGVTRWNEAVSTIIDVSSVPKWEGLENARLLLSQLE